MKISLKSNGKIIERSVLEIEPSLLKKYLSKVNKQKSLNIIKFLYEDFNNKSDENILLLYQQLKKEEDLLDKIVIEMIGLRKILNGNLLNKMECYNKINKEIVDEIIVKYVRIAIGG